MREFTDVLGNEEPVCIWVIKCGRLKRQGRVSCRAGGSSLIWGD